MSKSFEFFFDVGSPASCLADTQVAKVGFATEALKALAGDPVVRDSHGKMIEEAAARGVFGAPALFAANALYFGQDRLDFVVRAPRRMA